MDRKIELTLFAGFHIAKLISKGGKLPPTMTYDDVENWIDNFCDECLPKEGPTYADKLERAMIYFIKQAVPDMDEETAQKLLVSALKEVE